MRTFATPTRTRSRPRAPAVRRRLPALSRNADSTLQRARIRQILHGATEEGIQRLCPECEEQVRRQPLAEAVELRDSLRDHPDPGNRSVQRSASRSSRGSSGSSRSSGSSSASSGSSSPSSGGGGCKDPYRPPTKGFRVCSRSLQGFLGLFANHAYVEAPPADRYAIITRCTPTSGSDNVLTGTAAAKTDRSPDPCCKEPNCVKCTPRPGVTNLAACLRSAFGAYNDPSLYKGLGPNSNTFAGTLARACCDTMVPKPSALGNVPGWSDPPAPGRAATCPPGRFPPC